ncbi:peptidase, M16 family protein [Algoriphagus sp. Y33]|uniref:peptidase, M16 family protein n=1 Tax=Algoriphagus sp. Y33 TaxID=2772483 RepID=UPI00177CDEED|nr:peptidase, M16 family protein [Algoriphagus sp. Y33]
MKKSILIFALALLALPVATKAGMEEKESLSIVKVDNSVKEVIDSYVKATGGEANMKAVRNMEMKMQAEIQGMMLDISSVVDRENQRLLNLTEMDGNVLSKTVLKDGVGKVTAMGQEQVFTEEQVEAVRNQVYAFRELYLDELGINVTYGGTAEIEGEQAHKLIFEIGGEGNTTEYYSVATGLKLQTESTEIGTVIYKDYQEVDGLMMPMAMSITNSMMPMPMEARVISILFNQDLDDTLFN